MAINSVAIPTKHTQLYLDKRLMIIEIGLSIFEYHMTGNT